MLIETAHVETRWVRMVQKLAHQPWHARGRELSVSFARENQAAMPGESLSRAFGIGRGGHGIGLARQQQRRYVASQGRVQVGHSLQISATASSCSAPW
jgi:hypothetical protein